MRRQYFYEIFLSEIYIIRYSQIPNNINKYIILPVNNLTLIVLIIKMKALTTVTIYIIKIG